jgi:hypothetical protein
MRTIILRDAWLIDNDHEDDEGESASGTESDEDTSGASAPAEQSFRPHESGSRDCGDCSGGGVATPREAHRNQEPRMSATVE